MLYSLFMFREFEKNLKKTLWGFFFVNLVSQARKRNKTMQERTLLAEVD
jgi:hypothetical protein